MAPSPPGAKVSGMRARWTCAASLLVLTSGCASTPEEATAGTDTALTAPERPVYLALGDSVAFGYDINHRAYQSDGTSKDLPDQAAHAIGYPEALSSMLAKSFGAAVPVANTACPGEATGSLITGQRVDDNDCYENRHAYRLHYEYDHQDDALGAGRSQLDHAVEYLAADPTHVKLVTITAGANDVLRHTAKNGGLPNLGGAFDEVMNRIEPNWETILGALARTGYRGPVVAVLYYSTGYRWTDLPTMAGMRLLNAKIHDAAKAVVARHPSLNVKFVEGYDIFEEASRSAGGDPCNAGLTMRITQGPAAGSCDVHPSHLGEEKLAEGVWRSLSPSEQAALLGHVAAP